MILICLETGTKQNINYYFFVLGCRKHEEKEEDWCEH